MHADKGLLDCIGKFLHKKKKKRNLDYLFNYCSKLFSDIWTHRVHGETGSVPVQRRTQLLQLVVDSISLSETKGKVR